MPALTLPVAYRDDDIAVYAVGGDAAGSPHRPVMIAAHAVWLGQLGLALAAMIIGRLRSRHAHRRDEDEQRPQTGHQ